MNTIQIPIPEGHTASFDKATGKVTFHPIKDVTERIKTLEDAITELGDKHPDVKNFGSTEFVFGSNSHITAYCALVVITKVLNEGWELDWSNSDQPKYYPWFEMGGSSGFRFFGYDTWSSASYVGSRLCFKSSELAEYAGKQFESLYKQWLRI